MIREMTPEDIGGVMAVQRVAYFAIEPESVEVMCSKLACGCGSCFVFEEERAIKGYLLGHPWRADSVPSLHQKLTDLPETCDSLYLHDMALLPELRGQGIAGQLFDFFRRSAAKFRLRRSHLVAIQGAENFWQTRGYRRIRPVNGYGTTAFLMERCFDEMI